MNHKVNKDTLIKRVAVRHNLTQKVVSEVFDALVQEIIESAKEGKEVALRGFGSFYLQEHKGHPVQFGEDRSVVDDYVVFKFSTSNVLNEKMREYYKTGNAVSVRSNKKKFRTLSGRRRFKIQA